MTENKEKLTKTTNSHRKSCYNNTDIMVDRCDITYT